MPRPKKVVLPDIKLNKKVSQPEIKLNKADENEFPHSEFPVKVIHKDGKELLDKKTCYFQSVAHAQKYLDRSKFKKTDYNMICRDDVQGEKI